MAWNAALRCEPPAPPRSVDAPRGPPCPAILRRALGSGEGCRAKQRLLEWGGGTPEEVLSLPSTEELVRYADVIVRVGANITPGQPVTVSAPLETADFTRLLCERLYAAGAGIVRLRWHDPLTERMALERAGEAELGRVGGWELGREQEEIDRNTCFIHVDAEDPDLLKGVDPGRVQLVHKARGEALKPAQDRMMADEATWVVCAAPAPAWAQRMYPEAGDPDSAVAELWQALLRVMRADTADAVERWQRHLDDLERRAAFLNDHHFRRLHYRAPGTDLHVELPELHVWSAARSRNARGAEFCANLPTEEVYTLPSRDGVEGTVRATMPLVHQGVVIEDIEITFQGGQVRELHASQGEATLRQVVETDKGSGRLGEVALVPATSPVAREGRLFYSTLFDENASCHLALGHAYPTCLKGGRAMSEAELEAAGLNDSIVHVDFMVGSEELDIDGETAAGDTVPVFRSGLWAF